MFSRHVTGVWCGIGAAIAGAVLWGTLAARPSCAAAEPAKAAGSLRLVPDSVAFCDVMLRNREQFDAVVNSRAWAKLKGLPFVQKGLGLYAMMKLNPTSPPAKLAVVLEDPEVRKVLDLGLELLSDEVFICGEEDCADFFELAAGVVGATRFGPAIAQLTGEAQGRSRSQMKAQMLFSTLADDAHLLKVPHLLLGFKARNPAAVRQHLDGLEKAAAMLENRPQLKGRVKKSRVAGHDYLTLSLDGQMIPWDKLPADALRALELKKGDIDKVIARVKQLKAVIAVGLRGDYLLVSLGPSTDMLARLGQGRVLADRPELAPLARFVDRRITSVAYMNTTLATRLSTNKKDVDDLIKGAEEGLNESELTDAQKVEIRKDLARLAADLKGLLGEAGPTLDVTFLTDRGFESYQYDWTKRPWLAEAKALRLAEHVGGNPLFALAGRCKLAESDYDLLAKWAVVGYGYFEKYALPTMSADERAEFEKFMKRARPLAKRFDDATRRMLIPALADGQAALVVDAHIAVPRPFAAMPPAEQPLPLPAPALVLAVSDAALLTEACRQYVEVARGLLDAARQIDGAEIPENFRIPQAQASKSAAGTIYAWRFPREWGVEPSIVPNAGLSDKVAVVSLYRGHTNRLLTPRPATVGGRPLDTSRPPVSMMVLDFAGLLDAIGPWIDYAVQQASGDDADENGPATTRGQIRTMLQILKVFRNVHSVSYAEGKALVTRSEIEIRDIE